MSPAVAVVPGFVANQCPDSTGSLVGGSVLFDVDKTNVTTGQLQWSIGAQPAKSVNDFAAAMANPLNDPDQQTWGWEKVTGNPADVRMGAQAWRLSQGLLDSGACGSSTKPEASVTCHL